MKDKIEICKKCEEILDIAIRQVDVIDVNLCYKIEKFLIDNYESLKGEKEYKVLIMKYILLREGKK